MQRPRARLASFLGAFDAVRFNVVATDKLELLLRELESKTYTLAPSNTRSKEFKEVEARLSPLLEAHLRSFTYTTEETEFQNFIQSLHSIPSLVTPIDTLNFKEIFRKKWRKQVKPSISIAWDKMAKAEILDVDFYLADLLSDKNQTILELNTRLVGDHYEFNIEIKEGLIYITRADFKNNQQAHTEFWKVYQRPPAPIYQDFILERRDLLVGKEVWEYKGAFTLPRYGRRSPRGI
ncbi:hypothetical protein [Helicobacter salomonis]|uniref:hypothetical protein n=1 Tax=Helicobacter salomonis TaxID=56878 RepID=UPI000CF119C3|nr:hypothetical protein [Helicobacter salomonis]